jgi:serine protease DegQ
MRRIWLIFSQAVTVAVAVLFVIVTLKPDWLPRGSGASSLARPDIVSITEALAPSSAASGPVAGGLTAAGQASFAAAVRAAAPAVVSISASRPSARHPHANDPWFRFFGGSPQSAVPQQLGLGSGVIVSPQGYLLTNNHVIQGATDIEVTLLDGRKAQARVVGTDAETDLAVLKIDLERVPSIVFAASDSTQVGDVVLAIGNPFGLAHTVTSGIVSALNRSGLGVNTFENFMQTDAAINPGNSGGALVDAQGRLVGINTAIYSRSGGNQGIGFAIPVGLAREVMGSLIEDGEVSRGWIGAEPRDLTPELAQGLGVRADSGALIAGVLQSGPAAAAGIRPGDVVVKVQDQPIGSERELRNAVARLKPGSQAVFALQRRDQSVTVNLTVGKRPAPQAVVGGRGPGSGGSGGGGNNSEE